LKKKSIVNVLKKLSIAQRVLVIFAMIILTLIMSALIFVFWWFSPCIFLAEDHIHEAGYIQPKPISVSYLTLNMFLRTTFIVDKVTASVDDYKDERMWYFIDNEMSKFGILSLQETWMMGNDRKRIIIDAAKKKGYQFARSTCRSIFRYGMDSMLLQLSQHPIEQYDEHTYSTSMDVDAMASKGVMWSRISIGGHPECTVDVYNTHLQAGGGDQGSVIRQQQFEELHEFMLKNDQLYGVRAKIISGDFNTDANNITAYNWIRQKFSSFTDLQNAAGITSQTTAGDGSTDIIDYILFDAYNSSITVIHDKTKVEQFRTGEIYATVSDHYGVSTILVCN